MVKVTFIEQERSKETVVQVDPGECRRDSEGLPGSLLDIAMAHGVPVRHFCGGNGVCGSCRVVIRSGEENLSPMADGERETMEDVSGPSQHSRLACQAVVQKGDVTVVIPVRPPSR